MRKFVSSLRWRLRAVGAAMALIGVWIVRRVVRDAGRPRGAGVIVAELRVVTPSRSVDITEMSEAQRHRDDQGGEDDHPRIQVPLGDFRPLRELGEPSIAGGPLTP